MLLTTKNMGGAGLANCWEGQLLLGNFPYFCNELALGHCLVLGFAEQALIACTNFSDFSKYDEIINK